MISNMHIFNHRRRRGWPRGLALWAALLGILLMGSVAFAQTGTVYTLSNSNDCTAFATAIGADFLARESQCYILSGTLVAADTLTVAGSYSLRPQGGTNSPPHFTNYGVININSSNSGLYNAGTLDNRGSLNINGFSQNYVTVNNYGTITISAAFFNSGTINNFGTIICLAGGSIQNSSNGTVNGNLAPTCDQTPPSVTINQATGQADPTSRNPVRFTAQFSKAVTGFTAADVTLSGTANLSAATVTVSGGPNTYEISVGGLAGSGTVIATIPANAASDAGNNGNTASTSTDNSVTFIKDETPPIILPVRVGTLGNNNWYVSDVNLTWSVVDPESTVTSQSGCEPRSVTNDTALVAFNCFATSLGGTESDTAAIKRDATVPTISAAATEPPNVNGWYNSNVTVHFICSDATSGVTSCPADQVLSNEGAAVASTAQTITDLAGNTSVPSNIVTVQLDKSAPEVTVTGVSAGADYPFDSVPTAACVTTDALSGVASAATLSVSGGNADGTGTFTATCSEATDKADNSSAPVSVSYTVLPPPDTTAPVITPNIDGTLGDNGWYTSDVTVSWRVVDDESAITDQNGCETQNITSDTAGVTFTCVATSAGGSNSQSVTIKRDATAPTIRAAALGDPNAAGWYNRDVLVAFVVDDALSGIAGADAPPPQVLTAEGSAISSSPQTVTDRAGNTSAPSNIVTVKIDKTAPIVTVTGVSDGAGYTLGSVPTAACDTSDATSGVATQATVNVSGGNADGTGSFTATCSGATDNAGNSGSTSVNYSVLYNWNGFLAPVENLPTVNTVNAGQAIPIKFSLSGDYGLDIFASGYPASQSVSCGGGSSATNPIEETGTPGNSSLHYDPTTQIYTYNWKTDKGWGGSCRQLIVKLIDGSEHIALFQFNGRARSAAASGADETAVEQIFLPVVSR